MTDWLAVIPGKVLSDPNISTSAKVVYGAISSFTANGSKEAFPSHAAIAERAGLGKRTISRLVGELIKASFITVHRRGRKLSNTYTVIALKSDITEKRNHNPAMGDDAGMSAPSIKRILKKKSIPALGKAEEIYTMYAAKIRPGAKADAIRSINKRLKEHSIEDLVNTINRYAATKKGRGDVEYRYQANNFFGKKEYFKEYLQDAYVAPQNVPQKAPAPEDRVQMQRLIDGGLA